VVCCTAAYWTPYSSAVTADATDAGLLENCPTHDSSVASDSDSISTIKPATAQTTPQQCHDCQRPVQPDVCQKSVFCIAKKGGKGLCMTSPRMRESCSFTLLVGSNMLTWAEPANPRPLPHGRSAGVKEAQLLR